MREKLNLRSTSELIRYATRWISERTDAIAHPGDASGDEVHGS
jgi:hypothetical protein